MNVLNLVEEHLNSNNSPFRFNAKELDEETGNYYYGARYYDPKWSIWISVDPLAELMPEWSSYAYTFNNPINWTDSTGMCPDGDCPDDAKEGDVHQWDGATWISDGDGNWNRYDGVLDEVVVTGSSNPHHISNGNDSHIITSVGESQDFGALGSTTNGGLALPRDFGDWNTPGSDGRQWIGTMACHGTNGEYRTLAYNSPSRFKGLSIAGTFNAGFAPGTKLPSKGVFNSTSIKKAFQIQHPNALNQVKPGYSDAVNGSSLRTGRGPMIDYPTHKPAIRDYNSKNLNKLGRNGMRVTGTGLSGLSLYYYYEKSKKSK